MVPNSSLVPWRVIRRIGFSAMLFSALSLMSCGSSQEAATEEEAFDEEPLAEQAAPAQEEAGDQQALTSFIGAAPKKEEPKKEEPLPVQEPFVQKTTPPPGDLEGLRTQNTSLQQQIVKLEQDTRSLSARLSDAETKYMAEKDRANKAEEAAKVAAQSAAISARTSFEPMSNDLMTAYKDALVAFNSKAYDAAIMKFEGVLKSGVGTGLADNCHYWIGESNYGKKNYAGAVRHFETVLQDDKSEKLADANFMLGQCYEHLGQKDKAKEHYEIVARDFPMSGNVSRAKQRAARL
ncbi:MAG: tetratricopeptide repeat protein [Bacteroidota bacterium]